MSSPSSPDARALAVHLDLVGGIAGDMFVAAMVDALPALEAPVVGALAAVRPEGAAMPEFPATTQAGLRARRFAAGTYRHAAQPAHRAYVDIRRTLESAPLAPAAREHALQILALLARAEASVHGTTVDEVHFHELADWHSLMDVVAAGCIAAELAGAQWSASALPLGGGQVRTAHGTLPVPAPATSALLAGYPWHDDGLTGERVTPTGAAILRHLVAPADCVTRAAAGRLLGVGAGAGTRTLPGKPNIVRALVFERTHMPIAADIDADVVAVLEFDVDDMTGEEIALAADRLRAVTGAIDVSIAARVGKKGRPGTEFRVLAQSLAATAVAQACFTETSTLGLRVREERRHVLRRTEVATAQGVSVKLARRPGGTTGKAAHDDLRDGAGLDARRQSSAAAVQRAVDDD